MGDIENKGSKGKINPSATDEEREFILRSGQMPFYASAFLTDIRSNNRSLAETFQEVMREEGQEEHHHAYIKTRDFLAENAEIFEIRISPEPIPDMIDK